MDDLLFTQMQLNRKSSERKSSLWLKEQLRQQQSMFIPMWKGNYFFSASNAKNDNSKIKQLVELKGYKVLSLVVANKRININEYIYFLGENKNTVTSIATEQDNSAIFVIELSILLPLLTDAISGLSSYLAMPVELLDFRTSIAFINNEQASFLGYGRSLSNWHLSAQFCGYCATKTIVKEAGHSRQCQSEGCQKISFPRTDPVVIMLVEYQEQGKPNKCLLAGHTRSPENLLSTIAGFVDPGESLEQAVIREVYEEVGLEVEELEYIASQPWAFPNSLMIGFYVKAKTNIINIDQDEISRAHWFTAQEVTGFSDWGDTNNDIQIPRKESISRYLIEHWLERNNVK